MAGSPDWARHPPIGRWPRKIRHSSLVRIWVVPEFSLACPPGVIPQDFDAGIEGEARSASDASKKSHQACKNQRDGLADASEHDGRNPGGQDGEQRAGCWNKWELFIHDLLCKFKKLEVINEREVLLKLTEHLRILKGGEETSLLGF
mmetsp:Transcript_138180/g.243808  ORF Transcript_138180/g.243808 Transcript_138180/m.243808 type:complete len:147 (+) Transcript_138180:105-545(+)